MKIAILGTRGIPNNYGGFEQCAEKLALSFVEKGNEVTVYNPASNPYKKKSWNKVRIKKIFYNEKKLKFLNLFLYDYLCLKDAVKQDYDIILELGYSPCSLFYYLKKNRNAKIVTNMDGFDWKRSKWNWVAKKILKHSEKLAVKKSDALVADNPGIGDYIFKKYGINSCYIPYGAELFSSSDKKVLKDYNLKKYGYYILISRLEPENNIETILDGYIMSEAKEPFILIGPVQNKYCRFLKEKYGNFKNIRFLGGIYNYETLCNLRSNSKLYFHGHSVGGTNPSLLEAMTAGSFIVAHNNIFNKYVLGSNGFYFSNKFEISEIIINYNDKFRKEYIKNNMDRIKKEFSWKIVSDKYLKLFNSVRQ